jgi:hypothetical protein
MKTLLFLLALHAHAADVTLTWTDTANPPGTQYNAYRAPVACTASPTFAKINATPITPKSYTDASVPIGVYCYRVTAVASGQESAPSAAVGASVPPAAPGGLTISVTVTVTVP